jgi:hypothetical protein
MDCQGVYEGSIPFGRAEIARSCVLPVVASIGHYRCDISVGLPCLHLSKPTALAG